MIASLLLQAAAGGGGIPTIVMFVGMFAIAYLFGLGGGLHLLCLLTIPSLLILAWFSDRHLQRLILQLIGLGGVGFIAILALGPGTPSNVVMGIGLKRFRRTLD